MSTTVAEPLLKQLELARRDLLELSTRNRLLDTPRDVSRGTSIEIKDERTDDIFRLIVRETKPMKFEQGVEVETGEAEPVSEDGTPPKKKRITKKKAKATAEEEASAEAVAEEAPVEPTPAKKTKKSSSKAAAAAVTAPSPAPTPAPATTPEKPAVADKPKDESRYTDTILHTVMSAEELDRRLMGLYVDATTSFEEQGVNILYLALGYLKWYEAERPDKVRYAPLLLIPVKLEREGAGSRFALRYTEDEITTNLTLKTRLKADFGIQLPEVPDVEDLVISEYFEEVKKCIIDKEGWELLPDDMVLWFFSFSKLLMYRDLEPESWPEQSKLEDRPLIRALLVDGFASEPPLCGENQRIDSLLDPAKSVHVIDCDSSQTLVVEEASRGRNLVIQGPPGTGKSQTITNLIAGLVKAGKTVLFVAEKMAALEVVKRRLDNIGLGDMCLELHSDKASKRTVLQDLESTLQLGKPKEPPQLIQLVNRLRETRDQLNQHADMMHTPATPSGLTPFKVLCELIKLRADAVPTPDFQLAEADSWTQDQFRDKQNQVKDLLKVTQEVGDPSAHAWRGSQLDSILPTDLERLAADVQNALPKLDEALLQSKTLADQLGDDPPTTLDGVLRFLRTLKALALAPAYDAQALVSSSWHEQRKGITDLAEAGRDLQSAQLELQNVVTEAAWTAELAPTRQAIATHGASWFRMFRSSYRSARAAFKSLLLGPAPGPLPERLRILDLLIVSQRAKKNVQADDELGKAAFGKLWRGERSDWAPIVALEKWEADTVQAQPSAKFRQMLGKVNDQNALNAQTDKLETQWTDALESLGRVFESAKLDIAAAFPYQLSTTSAAASDSRLLVLAQKFHVLLLVPLATLRERASAWRTQTEAIHHWITYRGLRDKLKQSGVEVLVARLDAGKLSPDAFLPQFKFGYYEAVLKQILKTQPTLGNFDGARLIRVLEEFKQLDQQRLSLARAEIAGQHFGNMPRGSAAIGEVGVLRHEMQKKRRHLPLRQLLKRAGRAIRAIKPVFMMSPQSIAQFLEPGALDFEVLVIDEASQIRPVDAIGAAARCKQMIVVGDDKQMPPTSFFSSVTSGEGLPEDDEPDMQASDVESILGLCLARNMPQRMLRWHYRSRHHSLIAVSNKEFYDDKLYVIPSPERSGEMGLKFHYLENGRFERGKARANKIEAKIVADAVMEHAKVHPNWSLGVATFSVTQRDTVLHEVEMLRRQNPQLEKFFDTEAADPFFVKNLENVQGDERDVIFVSVGYGPDEDGKISLNFGPVSAQGGERRLNVLMTRAKRRCEIFSSLRPEDIDLSRATGRGPATLRAFLEYAQKGGDFVSPSSSDGSSFANLVKTQLEKHAYEVKTNVGIAGLFLDLAVVDPKDKSRFLLGIECDGDSYYHSRSARDRDRLREQALTGQGWRIYRLWCADWFQRPDEQLKKLLAALEQAKQPAQNNPGKLGEVYKIERHDPSSADLPEEKKLSVPYVEANFEIKSKKEISELPVSQVTFYLAHIVDSESPIHGDELSKRFLALAGVRSSAKLTALLEEGTKAGLAQGTFFEKDGFYLKKDQGEFVPRDRSEVSSTGLRKPEMLHPGEAKSALLKVLEGGFGASADETVTEASRILGFRSTTQALRDVLQALLTELINLRQVEVIEGKLQLRG